MTYIYMELRACLTLSFQIDKAAERARSADIHMLKSQVILWLPDYYNHDITPAIIRDDKSDRGFEHPATADLLIAPDMDWNHPTYVRHLINSRYF